MDTNTDTVTVAPVVAPEFKGAFFESLNRNNKSIKKDRAESITEDAQTFYKREIEDMKLALRKLTRERENALDLSASDKNSLIVARSFDAKEFVANDLDIGVRIRTIKIRLEIAEESYSYLFGNA